MFNEEGRGVVFYETVLNFKWQKHTCIECVPVPYDLFEQLPGYFKVRLLRQLSYRACRLKGTLGIYPHVRNGMVSTQKVDRLFCKTRRFSTFHGPKPALFHGSVRL